MSRQVIRITAGMILLGLSFPAIGHFKEEEVDRRVYQRGLTALRNIIDVRDELEERLEDLVDQEKKIGDEKKELRLVVKDIDGVFPKGKENLSVRARGFERRIRDIDREDKKHLKRALAYLQKTKQDGQVQQQIQEPSVVKPKSNKGVIAGVLVGAVVSLAAGFFFWKVVGKKRSKKNETCDKDYTFIKNMADYLEKQV